MTRIQVITLTEGHNRTIETTSWGYVDKSEVAALMPLRPRQINGEWQAITEIVLRNGATIEATGTPDAINEMLDSDSLLPAELERLREEKQGK